MKKTRVLTSDECGRIHLHNTESPDDEDICCASCGVLLLDTYKMFKLIDSEDQSLYCPICEEYVESHVIRIQFYDFWNDLLLEIVLGQNRLSPIDVVQAVVDCDLIYVPFFDGYDEFIDSLREKGLSMEFEGVTSYGDRRLMMKSPTHNMNQQSAVRVFKALISFAGRRRIREKRGIRMLTNKQILRNLRNVEGQLNIWASLIQLREGNAALTASFLQEEEARTLANVVGIASAGQLTIKGIENLLEWVEASKKIVEERIREEEVTT